MSEVLIEEVPGLTEDKVVVLSGPSHAEEVSRNIPTTVVAASKSLKLRGERPEGVFHGDVPHLYQRRRARAWSLPQASKTSSRLRPDLRRAGLRRQHQGRASDPRHGGNGAPGQKNGRQEQTFFGLAGIGDLITTCTSRHSRNRRWANS